MHALLAATDGWHHDHWWIVFPIFWALFLVAVLTLFWRRGCGPYRGYATPQQILAERFARGEIDAAEYENRLGKLR
jgi:putative membrane protein